jgi:hypothetical protein
MFLQIGSFMHLHHTPVERHLPSISYARVLFPKRYRPKPWEEAAGRMLMGFSWVDASWVTYVVYHEH